MLDIVDVGGAGAIVMNCSDGRKNSQCKLCDVADNVNGNNKVRWVLGLGGLLNVKK